MSSWYRARDLTCGMAAVVMALGSPAIAAVVAIPGATQGRNLRGVTLATGREGPLLEIELEWPFRYESHSPPRRGRNLEIRLRVIQPSDVEDWRETDVIPWGQSDLVPLEEIELAPDALGSPVLRLRFSADVEFSVSQGGDPHRLQVEVRRVARPDTTSRSQRRLTAPPPPGGDSDDAVGEIIAEGRRAMVAGELRRAILLFTQAVESGAHPRVPEAKELLGLAYQRRGKWAHARAEYEEFLEAYPEHEAAPRVRQRLQALLTAAEDARPRRQRPSRTARAFRHDLHGGISQFYRSNVLESDESGTETANNALDSDIYISSRHSGENLSIRTNLAGGYRHDFEEEEEEAGSTRISTAFADIKLLEGEYTTRIGRQTASGGGVLGRFDGVQMGARVGRRWTLKAVSGLLVDFTESNQINTDRPFYGVSAEFGRFLVHWDAEVFAIRQMIEGIEDRRALGAQVRFISDRGFGLGLVDYEISYGALSSLMLIGNWRLTDATSVNAFIDVRSSPALTTFNALQGQAVASVDDLQDLFTEDEIRQLAEDRTAMSRMVTLGASHQLNSTWQLSGDVTVSDISSTETSGGVDATPGTGNEYFAALRAGASNLLLEGSYTNFGVRYAHAATGRRYLASLGGRYPVIGGVRTGPQFMVERRDNDGGETTWTYRPSLRLDIRWRRVQLELEGGMEFERGTVNDQEADEREYFWSVGYRFDF